MLVIIKNQYVLPLKIHIRKKYIHGHISKHLLNIKYSLHFKLPQWPLAANPHLHPFVFVTCPPFLQMTRKHLYTEICDVFCQINLFNHGMGYDGTGHIFCTRKIYRVNCGYALYNSYMTFDK